MVTACGVKYLRTASIGFSLSQGRAAPEPTDIDALIKPSFLPQCEPGDDRLDIIRILG